MKSYGVALSSSLSISLGLRKLLAPMTANASGKRLLLLNTFVGLSASSMAGFSNSLAMRYKEIDTGIKVYKDEALT